MSDAPVPLGWQGRWGSLRLLELTYNSRPSLALAAACALFSGVLTGLQGLLLGPVLRLVLGLSDGRTRPMFSTVLPRVPMTLASWSENRCAVLGTLALVATLRAAVLAAEAGLWARMSETLALRLRLRALRALLHVPLATIEGLPSGVASARLIADPKECSQGALGLAAALWQDGGTQGHAAQRPGDG